MMKKSAHGINNSSFCFSHGAIHGTRNRFCGRVRQKVVQLETCADPWEKRSAIWFIQPDQIFAIAQVLDLNEVNPPRPASHFGSGDLAGGYPLADGLRRHIANLGGVSGGSELRDQVGP